jgi:hypothetical protein
MLVFGALFGYLFSFRFNRVTGASAVYVIVGGLVTLCLGVATQPVVQGALEPGSVCGVVGTIFGAAGRLLATR